MFLKPRNIWILFLVLAAVNGQAPADPAFSAAIAKMRANDFSGAASLLEDLTKR